MAAVLQQQRKVCQAWLIVRKHNGQDRRVDAEGVATCLSRNDHARTRCGMAAWRCVLLFADNQLRRRRRRKHEWSARLKELQ
jgi:hypothetical protein